MSATPVAAPINVTLTPDHNNNNIDWDLVADATSYNIYWLNADGVTIANGNVIANAAKPYIHSNLTSGLNYYYIVTCKVAY